MIGISSSSRSFAALGKYLVYGREGASEDRVTWSAGRNLPTDDPHLAAKIMRATASENVRVSQPVYHLALSFDPRDAVSRATMERVADRVLAELKLHEHQALIVAHGDRAHAHVHVLVNRVHPETGRVWDRWQDYPAIQRVLREQERALGLRVVEGGLGESREGKGWTPDQASERRMQEWQGRSRRTGGTAEREALRVDIDGYLRVSELARQRHLTERDVSAARASLETTGLAIERATRAESAFDQALRRSFRDPVAAKSSFLRTAEERGVAEAARQMRDDPGRLGQLLPDRSGGGFLPRRAPREEGMVRSSAREASMHGVELVAARQEVALLVWTEAAGPKLEASVATQAVGAKEAVHARLVDAQGRETALGREERALPSRRELEARLTAGLQRLAPPEFERLRKTLSGQQFNVALKLRQLVRDAALGREGEE